MGGLPSVRLARLARDAAATVTQLPVVDGTGIDPPPPATLSELTRMVDGSQEEASKRVDRADWDEMLGHHLGSVLSV